jgi:LysM repeat protein/lysophospholipase L1-like esterase
MKLIKKVVICSVIFLLSGHIIVGAQNNNDKLFANEQLLSDIFEKLYNLEQSGSGKVNIVHVGDSHVQAGFFTDAIRRPLQEVFGNGGYGFVFPYSLVRTNGPRNVKYVTNVAWESQTNVRPWSNIEVGLSGIALYTSTNNYVLQLTAEDSFNKVKVIYPSEKPQVRLSTKVEPLKVSSTVSTNVKYHRIKSGETLSVIARKYGVTVAQLKKANNMRSDRINAGKSLKIPSKTVAQVAPVILDKNVECVELQHMPYCSYYTSGTPLDRISILPVEDKISRYTLNGIVLENDKKGVIYHSIGVNGATLGDYNKYPLFFKQLTALEPDLVIISLGTNESFARMSAREYMDEMQRFIANVLSQNQSVSILVVTPPPSILRRRRDNPYLTEFIPALNSQNGFPVWDMYTRMGGIKGIQSGPFAQLVARDKVHYTQQGYEQQGFMFASDFIDAYNNYKTTHKR